MDPFGNPNSELHHIDPQQYLTEAADSSQTDYSIEQPKPAPIKAAAGQIHKPGRRLEDPLIHHQQMMQQANMTEDGKVRCGCGGTHWPTGTPRGAASWRSHVSTKRHQKWIVANGMLGEV